MTTVQTRIEPQEGKQKTFLSSTADIAIFGGGAGSGKSWSLLLEAMRNCHVGAYRGVLFRRTFPQITNPGGLWDESTKIYPHLFAKPRQSDLLWVFPSGARIEFAHLQHEKNVYDWQGAQIPFLGFDEATHFSEFQFFYLLSRNRSMSGVRPYVRMTCNPDPDSFVARMVDWWLHEDGYPIPERSGVLRWFVRVGGELDWADTPEELTARHGKGTMPKSLTFIPALVTDNPALLAANPEYLANLKALPYVEQMRLLYGNWKVRPSAGKVFNRSWFEVVDAAPAGGRVVRFWDFAATEKKQKGDDPDWTVGLRLRWVNGVFYIEDVRRERATPAEVKRLVKVTATQDGYAVAVGFEVEGGSAGKFVQGEIVQLLAGWNVRGMRPATDKVTRAGPAAAQALAGNIKLVRGEWNDPLLGELHGFPDLPHDDQVDGLSGAVALALDLGVGEAAQAQVVSRQQIAELLG